MSSIVIALELSGGTRASASFVHVSGRPALQALAAASFVRGLVEGGWTPILARFAALARGDTTLPGVEGPGCIESKPTEQ
jgi:hypothetical protein